MTKVIIIGAGVAGLSAGIYARVNGYEATIYEKHYRTGGNLTGWDRNGYHIDNCIHWLTGTNKNTSLYSMWQDLGVLGNVDVYQGETLYTFRKDGKELSLYNDINKLKNEMLNIAREDKKEILNFINAIKVIQGIEGTLGENNNEKSNILEKIIKTPLLLKYYKMSTKDLSDRFSNPILKGFIVSLISEYFSSIALLIVFATFTSKNGGIPVGSSCEMAKRLTERFISLGGNIYLNNGVKKININNNRAESITLENGDIVEADYIVTTIDPMITFNSLIDNSYMPKELSKLYNNPKMMRFSSYHCAFSCEKSNLPFKSDVIYEIPDEYREILKSKYIIVREFSHEKGFAPKGKNILQTMIYCNETDAIEFINLSKDREKYKKRKEEISEIVKKVIIHEFPILEDKLKCIDVWTPSSYKRYTSSDIGSFMSFVLPPKTIPRKISGKIKGLDNVILATQWQQAPGGLPIAAKLGRQAIEIISKNSRE